MGKETELMKIKEALMKRIKRKLGASLDEEIELEDRVVWIFGKYDIDHT